MPRPYGPPIPQPTTATAKSEASVPKPYRHAATAALLLSYRGDPRYALEGELRRILDCA